MTASIFVHRNAHPVPAVDAPWPGTAIGGMFTAGAAPQPQPPPQDSQGLYDGQAPGQFARAHRETVHRGIIETGQGASGDHVLGEHAMMCGRKRHAFAAHH